MTSYDRSAATADKLEAFRDLFSSFNLDGQGRIGAGQFRSVAEQFGYRLSDDDIQVIFNKKGIDINASIGFDELVSALINNSIDISEDEHRMADVRRKFSEYDSDGSGSVSAEEAHEILEKELAFSARQSADLVTRYDVNGDGQLSFEEFVRFYSKVKSKIDDVRRLFAEFDRDGSGSVSIDEAKVMLKHYGLASDQIDDLILKYDVDHDGELQYTEFAAFLMDC